MTADWKRIQEWAGVPADGIPGPATAKAIIAKAGLAEPTFDREAFLAQFVNTSASAIVSADIARAATRLNVTPKHVEMVRKVESGGTSFDQKGRPVILFEPHIFHRRTAGRFGRTNFSNPTWDRNLYPKSFDGRWQQLADAAAHDEPTALESASWGLFQIMGFHWQALGYASALDFAQRMTASEGEHLEALVRFIEKNGLAPALRRCVAGNPESCRDFAKSYNGAGYAANNYHIKMAKALA